MIKTLQGALVEDVLAGHTPKELESIMAPVERKLQILDSAHMLSDLRSPPGNRLEKLKRDRAGQHSIRINDQYRICFKWKDGDAYNVEITDHYK